MVFGPPARPLSHALLTRATSTYHMLFVLTRSAFFSPPEHASHDFTVLSPASYKSSPSPSFPHSTCFTSSVATTRDQSTHHQLRSKSYSSRPPERHPSVPRSPTPCLLSGTPRPRQRYVASPINRHDNIATDLYADQDANLAPRRSLQSLRHQSRRPAAERARRNHWTG